MKTEYTNPYVGLRPFDVNESILFFGRNEQTLELLQRLHQHHFVTVVGSSGSGKSSLLRAGLIPALKAGYLVEDSDHWFIAIMKPGLSPLYNLAEVILMKLNPAASKEDISSLVQKITDEGADALLNLIATLRKDKNMNFFLLVDQFEEIFRFVMNQKDVDKKDEANDFVNIILELSRQRIISFYVVIALRSDFIGDCAEFHGLADTMNVSHYLVPRLNRIELKMVIEGPAKLFDGKINTALISKLLNVTASVKDELPLLQHALMRIWDFEMQTNKSGELDIKDYESIGGIEKALSNHADEALAGLNEKELQIAKTLFQALTAIDDNGRKIRRPALLSQLRALTGADEEQLLSIINLFIKDRRSFLVINKAGDTGDKVIDISHESLILHWETLNRWVDEEGESAEKYLQLAQAAQLNKKGKKDYLTGTELLLALQWRNNFKPIAIWANRYEEGFNEFMEYLSRSEAEDIQKINVEKAKKKKLHYLVYSILGLLLIVAFGVIVSIRATNDALLQEKIARENKIKADRAEADYTKAKAEKERAVFDDLETQAKDILDGNFCPDIQLISMDSIAKINPDSLKMKLTINSIKKLKICK